MQWTANVLVVANVTATSEELIAVMTARNQSGPTTFTLAVPADPAAGGRKAAQEALDQALEAMREAGLAVEGHVSSSDPIVAVSDDWDPRRYDEIMIATLPMSVSKWLHAGLPERVERLTGARVTHVVAQPPKPKATGRPAPVREKLGVMAPLSVLAWARHRDS